jgi:hypothetical protein
LLFTDALLKMGLMLFLFWSALNSVITPLYAAPITHTYAYEDGKIRQVVVVRFLTEKQVAYTIRLVEKKTGKICQTQGHAFWDDPTGNAALVEDDQGNSYGAVDFYSKAAPLYTNLSFEYRSNGKVSTASKLQVSGAARVTKDGCQFWSAHTLRRIN